MPFFPTQEAARRSPVWLPVRWWKIWAFPGIPLVEVVSGRGRRRLSGSERRRLSGRERRGVSGCHSDSGCGC